MAMRRTGRTSCRPYCGTRGSLAKSRSGGDTAKPTAWRTVGSGEVLSCAASCRPQSTSTPTASMDEPKILAVLLVRRWRGISESSISRLGNFGVLARKEKSGDMAPRRAKDDESGADFSRARGKASLLLLLRETISGYHARVPCLNSHQLNACSPTPRKGSRGVVRNGPTRGMSRPK